jgi:PST family polysaccharide transporter
MSQGLSGAAARGTLWLGLVNVLSKGAQMLVILALGRFLDARELGTVTISVTLINLGQILQLMGVYDVISRTRRDPIRFAGTVAGLSVGIGTLLALVLLALADPIAAAVGTPAAAPLLRAAGLGLPFTAYAGVQLAYLHRELAFRRRLVPDAGSALLGAAVTVVAAAHGAGVWSLIAGLLTTAVGAPLLGLAVGVRIPLRFNRSDAAETLRWVRVTGPGAVIGVLLLQVDYIVVNRVLGEAQNGIYSFAYRIAFVPYITVAVVIGAVAFPVYARLADTGTGTGIRGMSPSVAGPAVAAAFARFWHVLVAVTGGLYVLLFVLADRIVVIDPRWAASVPILRVLCGYGLLLGLVLACHEAVRAIGRPRVYLRVQALHLVLLTGAAIALVRPAGSIGVAWAQVSAAATALAVSSVVLVRAGVVTRAVVRGIRGPLLAAAAVAVGDRVADVAGLLPPYGSLPGVIVLGAVLTAAYVAVLALLDRGAVGDLRAALRRDAAPRPEPALTRSVDPRTADPDPRTADPDPRTADLDARSGDPDAAGSPEPVDRTGRSVDTASATGSVD